MATERLIIGATPPLISHLHLLTFGGTLMVYNAPRIFFRRRTTQQFRLLYQLCFVVGLAMVLPCVFWLPWHITALCGVMAVLTFSYSLPVLPFTSRRLRELGWVKTGILATVWTVSTSLLPVLYWHRNPVGYPFEVLLRFIFIFALCIVFDIRDVRTDQRQRVATLPIRHGLHSAYKIIGLSLLLFAVLSVAQYLRYPYPYRLLAAWVTAALTWLVVNYLRKHPTERGYLALGDGVMLVYAGLAMIP